MDNKNKKWESDKKDLVRLICFPNKNLGKAEIKTLDYLCQGENVKNIGTDISYDKFSERLWKKRVIKRRMIITAACVIIFLFGLGVYASRTGFLFRFSKSNEIRYDLSNNVSDMETTFKQYDKLETALKDLKISLPVLKTFPEDLIIKNILVEKLGDTIKINLKYSSLESLEKIKVGYKYSQNPDSFISEVNINETYDYIGEISALGCPVHIYSDIERRIAVLNYDNVIMKIETVYTQEQLEEIIKNIEITPIG